MATWDKQSNEYNLHMSVNILYRVLIFTGSGFPNGKMKLLVGKFFSESCQFWWPCIEDVQYCKKCPVLSCLFCVVFSQSGKSYCRHSVKQFSKSLIGNLKSYFCQSSYNFKTPEGEIKKDSWAWSPAQWHT